MERERQQQRHNSNPGPDVGSEPDMLAEVRSMLGGILDAADRALDGIRPVVAEEYLQQNRQCSAQ